MSSDNEIIKEVPQVIRVFKDGRYEKLNDPVIIPAGVDPTSGVVSKDVVISPENNISARLYIPKTTPPNRKLPLLIYFHGGGFIVESPASSIYHNFVNLIVAESDAVVVVSVDYRLVPEFPLPTGHEDCWEAIKWVAKHGNGDGPDPWLNEYADLQNIFLAGDSAGGNIAHHMAIRVGLNPVAGIRVPRAILLNPYFWGKERVGTESESLTPETIATVDNLWSVADPGSGADDPIINPGMDPRIASICCSKILVYVGGDDFMRERDWYYKQLVEKSGWKGEMEVVEYKGEGHVAFLYNPSSPNARALRTRVCTFINN